MVNELEFWRQDPLAKVESIVRDLEHLARRSRAAGLLVTADILELAVEEARKDADIEGASINAEFKLIRSMEPICRCTRIPRSRGPFSLGPARPGAHCPSGW
jgi:hypothetical protein